MRTIRIYHPDTLATGQSVALSPDAGHHVARVLRLAPGAALALFNGDGHAYPGRITTVKRNDVQVEVLDCVTEDRESPLQLHLGQGISKGERMELVIQKVVELGVQAITPLITERCVVRLDAQRWQKKHQQWRKIAIGACEQCGRNRLPDIHPPVALSEWLNESTPALKLTLHPRAKASIAGLDRPEQGVRLLIGPEGGLSDAEVEQTAQAGFTEVLLGPRVLRTETASLTAVALLQGRFGDLS